MGANLASEGTAHRLSPQPLVARLRARCDLSIALLLSARLTMDALLRYSASRMAQLVRRQPLRNRSSMTDKSTTSGATSTSEVATIAPAASSTGKLRSGLTGHILPSFWQKGVSAASAASSGAPASAAPNATEASTPALPASVSRGRWWPSRSKHGESVGRATALIIACALLSLGIYLYGTLRFPLAAHLTPPPLDLGKLTSLASGRYSAVAGEIFLLSIGLLFGAWGLVCWIAGRIERQAQRGWWRTPWLLGGALFGFPLLALLVLLFMYPVTAGDVFDYASQIRVLTIYHSNPLTVSPSAFPHDPFLPFNSWPQMPASYGPVWALLSALVSQLAGNNFFAAIIAQKLLSILACLGCMGLIWLLAKRLCPERRWQAFVFVAWNPLVLFETGANGHNDILMVLFMLAALAALLATRWYWQALALPLLAASVLVKWTSALLIPLAVIYLLRGGRARRWGLGPLGIGAALTAALAIPVVAPFWSAQPWGVWLQSNLFTSSPPALLDQLLTPIYPPGNGQDVVGTAVRLIGLGVFALVYFWILARLMFPGIRERLGPEASLTLPQWLIGASLDSYFWYFVLAAFWFQPWYLLALLPLAALDPRPLARVRGALFAVGAALSYVIYIFIWTIYWQGGPFLTAQLAACFIIYALPLLARALEGLQTRRRLYALLASAQFPPAPAAANTPGRRKSWWLL